MKTRTRRTMPPTRPNPPKPAPRKGTLTPRGTRTQTRPRKARARSRARARARARAAAAVVASSTEPPSVSHRGRCSPKRERRVEAQVYDNFRALGVQVPSPRPPKKGGGKRNAANEHLNERRDKILGRVGQQRRRKAFGLDNVMLDGLCGASDVVAEPGYLKEVDEEEDETTLNSESVFRDEYHHGRPLGSVTNIDENYYSLPEPHPDDYDDDDPNLPWYRKVRWKHAFCRGIIVLSMILGSCFVLWDLIYVPYVAERIGEDGGESKILIWRNQIMEWMNAHLALGLVVLIALLTLSAVVFLPLSLLILSASFVYAEAYGFWMGLGLSTAACFMGACLGAVVAFLRSRYMTRDVVRKFSERFPIIRALDQAFKTKGLRIFFLLRLSPLVPFNALNYIGGITGVKFADFAVSLLGMIPGITFSCFLGASGKAIVVAVTGEHKWQIMTALACSVACGLLGIIWTGMHARKELADILNEQHSGDDDKTEAPTVAGTELLEDGLHGLELRGWDVARDLTLPPPPKDGGRSDEEWFWVYI
uniref:VTT domain-containing protein n=1 Tax=Odontella aurita TaxID=265563 RepID=A0A7S4JWU9_9STRA|mmetsp:Transcript_55403/g.166088  ORF Transcript_55403/g.166088 Transcript_55403/m.166088 type:complete len:535 (+) Transcript_55403:3-1607(+)